MGARRKKSKYEQNIIYNERSLSPDLELPEPKRINPRYKINEALEKL